LKRLAKAATAIITSRLGAEDVFARVGGDEFTIIASRESFKDITHLAEDLRSSVQNYSFEYDNQSFNVSVSIGVVPLTGKEKNAELILQDVDSACYVAKQWGRNRIHIAQIRHALNDNRLVLFYQPVHRILEHGTEMAHCEILLRIKSECGELLSPAEFIPIAEKYNLMAEVDRWVVANVMQWIGKHQHERKIPRLLINLSGLSFIDEDILKFVVNEVERNEIDPTMIAFEITETAAVDNLDTANEFIRRLREIGCQFALDDFGTGFSTFAYLKSLPINYLKIDGSLVADISTDLVDREMVRSINNIGHTVGAKTIAEYVGDEATVDILREMGVDYAQGFGIARPTHLDSLVQQLPFNDENSNEWQQAS